MTQERALKVVLVLVGLIFLVGVYPLMMFLWSSGWRWQPNQPEYEQMILGVYATLGIFLLFAARNPTANRSLIAFTAWFTPLLWPFRHSSIPANTDIC
jgi:energy-coupling factor transporter transmembrane protein EcfT